MHEFVACLAELDATAVDFAAKGKRDSRHVPADKVIAFSQSEISSFCRIYCEKQSSFEQSKQTSHTDSVWLYAIRNAGLFPQHCCAVFTHFMVYARRRFRLRLLMGFGCIFVATTQGLKKSI